MKNSEEHDIQSLCVEWFRTQYPKYALMLIAVPNAGKRSKRVIKTAQGYKTICTEGRKLKQEGMVAGVADLLLLLARNGYGHLAIEMKKPKKGYQSKEQKEWQKVDEMNGNKYVVCKSFSQFQSIIWEYLGSERS